MIPTLIENARLIDPGFGAGQGSVLIAEGKIATVNPLPAQIDPRCQRVDAQGATLTPGLIDLHCHGIHNWLYECEGNPIAQGSQILPKYGTTCVLPTLYTVMNRSSLGRLESLAGQLPKSTGACTPGFHLEGPFLKLPGIGAETVAGDLVLLEEVLAACHGRVRAMSVSPDTEGIIPVIERLRELNITPFITHTQASVDETLAAIAAGARHATHFYDVFPAPPEPSPGVRPVGAVETLLAHPDCTVDFICDGVHVHPMAIKAALAANGWQGVVAITDANIGAGLEDGVYESPWGYSVKVTQNDAARVADVDHPQCGQLAGSSLTMDRAMANLLGWLDLPSHQVWAMGTLNPARVVGLANKGTLSMGADSDLVLWDEKDGMLQVRQTWVAGKCVYQSETSLA
jgi:N-acetylglucosamine-6-phosphate deacetylase